jgi:UDP-N-acetylglucosamine 2-epimerase
VKNKWPEAVESGFGKVVGTKKRDILNAIKDAIDNGGKLPSVSPFGDEMQLKKIVNTLNFLSNKRYE